MTRNGIQHLAVFFSTGIAGYLFGGFIPGMMVSKIPPEADPFAAFMGRCVVGGVYCFMSIFSFGFPPTDFVSGKHLNCWPYIFGNWVVLFVLYGLLVVIFRYRKPKIKR